MWLTLDDAVDALKKGKVIAYPTEAVFGLGCDPANATAIALLQALKARAPEKGWILIADCVDILLPYIDISAIPSVRWQQIQAQWPGPHTWVFPEKSAEKNKENKKIAVRVTAHPVASALCHAFGKPLISTSANRGGASPLRDAEAVGACFGDQLGGVLPGEVDHNANPTSIQDAVTGEVYRHA